MAHGEANPVMAFTKFKASRTLRAPLVLKSNRSALQVLALFAVIGLSGCATSAPDTVIRIDKAQGSQQNIASLTSVISANPQSNGTTARCLRP